MAFFDTHSKVWKNPELFNSYPEDVHISEIILKSLKATPHRILQIFEENGAQMTCEELMLKATRIAQNLTKLGIKEGDVVGFNCTNSENICALIHGCIFIGAIISPMSLLHDKTDLIHMWSITEPKFIFCDAEVYDKVVEVLRDIENYATVCTLIERIDNVMFVDEVLATTGIEGNFEQIKSKNMKNRIISLSSSSGTTGPAKAVCVSQSYVLRLAEQYQNATFTRYIHFTPIFWVFASSLMVILPLTKLVRVATRRMASIENQLELVDKFKIEYLYTNSILLEKMLQPPLIAEAQLSTLKVIASIGSICTPDLRLRFKQKFPEKQLISLYGSTEIIHVWPSLDDDNQGYEVGHLMPNSEMKIVDDDGNNLGVDEIGEIYAKVNFPFTGYYKNPDATTAALDDEQFIKTGDVGYMNHNGILSIVGRKKDIFKYQFHHIYPNEIENIVKLLDGVEQVSVVGIPHENNHLACAVVKKSEGYEHLTKDDVIAYAADRLPEYKRLHGGVTFVTNFPTTPSGKIIRRLIEEDAEKEFKIQLRATRL